MTSEVCVMNRYAVVLAADSATTVTHGYGEYREERYFKGANKIFQLSNHHPVGMMVFDSAALLQVPWEIVVKSFRKELGSKSFNTLEEYAEEFFAFLETNVQLFPEEIRHNTLKRAMEEVAVSLIYRVQDGISDADQIVAAIDDQIERDVAALESRDYPGELSEADLESALAIFSPPILAELPNILGASGLPAPSDFTRLVRFAALDVLKDPDSNLTTTGLVFAGYGDHDIFPSMVEYASSGMIMSKFVRREANRSKVDYERPAGINAFAQTSMTDTFTLGVSMDVFMSLSAALNSGLNQFVDELCALAGADKAQLAGIDKLIADHASSIRTTWLQSARDEHQWPMRRVLAALPIDELAELAETLIRLQSLKEKVTKPSETVGGPVDVAVITKNEGLVWIRRKHYFDASLNPRYLQRLGA